MRRPAVWAEAQSFDRVAEDLDRLAELSRHELITSWLADVLPKAGRYAIDLGCGPGRQAVLLAGRFAQVDAVDLSGPMIELARARRPRPNISYLHGDLRQAGQAGHYDLVLCVRTLHHVLDLHAALSHLKRLLAPGGRLIVVDNYPPGSGPGPARRMLHRAVPLRPRLHALALQALAEPDPPRAAHRVGDLPAVHPPGMAGPPRERPVLHPRGAGALLRRAVPRPPPRRSRRPARHRAGLGLFFLNASAWPVSRPATGHRPGG
jgi:ubiquinone/menaquinone biosynthesis C-methylase UbiE